MSPKQDLIPLLSRTITINETAEKGSIFVGADEIAVEGIPWMIGDYKMCENSDQLIIFSSYCNLPEKERKDGMQMSIGILNKITGDVRYHRGEQLFILKCHKAEKVVK
jgi:malate/lactate dehydrogenase